MLGDLQRLSQTFQVRALKMVSMLRPLRLIGKTSSVRLIIEAIFSVPHRATFKYVSSCQSLLAAIPTLINMACLSRLVVCTQHCPCWSVWCCARFAELQTMVSALFYLGFGLLFVGFFKGSLAN